MGRQVLEDCHAGPGVRPLDRRPHHTRTKPQGDPARFWFRHMATMSRSFACGSEERFWHAFKNWMGRRHGWLGSEWIHR